MARDKGHLTDLQLRHWIRAGTPLAKADGNGLTFTLSTAGVAGWILRYRHGGRRRELLDRLAAMVPDAYASKAQLRTLQPRVKAWRNQRVKEMVLGSLRKSAAMPADV